MSEELKEPMQEQPVKEAAKEAPANGKKEKKKKTDEVLLALQKEKDELSDRLLRKVAEFDNYRKRTEKEKMESVSYGKQLALEGMLPVYDSLLLAAESACTDENYKKGVEMTLQMFTTSLEKLGVERMDCLGKPFDPNFHNAVMSEAVEGVESGTITKVLQNGYLQGEKVLRFAMVAVAE